MYTVHAILKIEEYHSHYCQECEVMHLDQLHTSRNVSWIIRIHVCVSEVHLSVVHLYYFCHHAVMMFEKWREFCGG